eukprot:scpid15509/ scgid0111/ Protein EMSY
MWRRQNDKDSISGFRARSYLRQLELEAYSSVVSAFLLQGDLTESRKLALQTVCNQLHISEDRHKAEIRRALCDVDLKKAAEILRGSDPCFLWSLECKHEVPNRPTVVPQNAVITATRHIVAAAVANQEITAQDVARHSMPKLKPPGHRTLFIAPSREPLTVDDLMMGTEPEKPVARKLSTREVMAKAIKALYDASNPPQSDAASTASDTTTADHHSMTNASSNVNIRVTSSQVPLSSSSTSPSPADSHQPSIAITAVAAERLCHLASRLIEQETRPVSIRNELPISTRGEASSAATTVNSRLLPPHSSVSTASSTSMDIMLDKKLARKKVGRRSTKNGDERAPKLGVTVGEAPLKGTPGRKPKAVNPDGRPKQRRRPKQVQDGLVDVKQPMVSSLPPLPPEASMLSLAPPSALPIGVVGIPENTSTLDLLAGMALERNLVGNSDGQTSISKMTTSVQAPLGLPPIADVPPKLNTHGTVQSSSSTLSLPLPPAGCSTSTQVLSPSLAAALPSSAWLTNAVSAVVPHATLLPGTSIAVSRASIGGAVTNVVSSTLQTCSTSTTVQPRVHNSGSPSSPVNANAALHSLAAAAIANRASPGASAASLQSGLPLLPLAAQQLYSSMPATDTLPHRSSFSSVTYQSESLTQLGIVPRQFAGVLRSNSTGSSSSTNAAASAPTPASSVINNVDSVSDSPVVTVQTSCMQASTTSTLSSNTGKGIDGAPPSAAMQQAQQQGQEGVIACSPPSISGTAVVGAQTAATSVLQTSADLLQSSSSGDMRSAAAAGQLSSSGNVTSGSPLERLPVVSAGTAGSSLLPTAQVDLQNSSYSSGGTYPSNGDESAGGFKQVSHLAADMSGNNDEVAAILQKAGSNFDESSPVAAGSENPLDDVTLPDDQQLDELIRMCQESDPSAEKMGGVSPDLARAFSTVASPTPSTVAAAAASLEQMVAATAMMRSDGVSGAGNGRDSSSSIDCATSVLSSAIPSVPESIDDLEEADGEMTLITSSVTANSGTSAGALDDSTRLSSTNDDVAVLIGEPPSDDGDQLLTEIVPTANGLSPDHPAIEDSLNHSVVLAHNHGATISVLSQPSPLPAPPVNLADCTEATNTLIQQPTETLIQQQQPTETLIQQQQPTDTLVQQQELEEKSASSVLVHGSAALVEPPSNAPQHQRQKSESPTKRPSTERRKRRSTSSDDDSWVKAALGLMQRMNKFRGHNRSKNQFNASAWFLQPVNPKTAPGYLDIVKKPMDFGTIKRKLEQDAYSTHMEWLNDIRLVRSNCHLYNSPEHPAVKDCEEVFAFFESEYEKLKDQWETIASGQPAKRVRPGHQLNT